MNADEKPTGEGLKSGGDLKKKHEELASSIRRESRRNFINGRRFGDQSNQQAADNSLAHLSALPDKAMLAAKITEWSLLPAEPTELYTFIKLIESNDILEQHLGVIRLRTLLCQKHAQPIQEVLDHKVLLRLLALAGNAAAPHLQLEATWCLANLASGTSAQTETMISHGAVPLFLQLALSDIPVVAEQAIWGLGNISGDCQEFRNLLVSRNAAEVLVQVFRRTAFQAVRDQIVWVLSNICRWKLDSEPIQPGLRSSVEILVEVFAKPPSTEVQDDALTGLYRCAKPGALDLFAQTTFLHRLHDYLRGLLTQASPNRHRLTAVNFILGGLTSSSNEHTMEVVRSGFLTPLTALLSSKSDDQLREVCWVLSNVAVGDEVQVSALLAEPELLERVSGLARDAGEDTSRDALWILCNLCTSKSLANVQALVNQGRVLDIFREYLTIDADHRKVMLVLEALSNLLMFFEYYRSPGEDNPFRKTLIDEGVSAQIEELQNHPSDAVYDKTVALIENHFDIEK